MSQTTATTTATDSSRFSRAVVALGLGTCWLVFAAAETTLGRLDEFAGVASTVAGRDRIVAAGLLHVLAGVLLGLGLAGVAARAWPGLLARTGLIASMVLAVCAGAYGSSHLVALEVATAGIDRQAAETFLVEALNSGGVWGVPNLLLAKTGLWALTLLLAGLARLGQVPWAAVAVSAAGALLHLLTDGDAAEVVSHWLVAAGMGYAAYALTRRP